MELVGGVFILCGLAAFLLGVLSLWKPGITKSKSRLGGFGKGVATSFVLTFIGGAIVGPTQNPPAVDTVEATVRDTGTQTTAETESVAKQEDAIEQAPELTIEELEDLLAESSAEVSRLSDQLFENYYTSRRTGNYAGFSLWRSKQWLPEVDALRSRYDEIKETHRRQINITHLNYILSGPTDLSLVSLSLIWKEGDMSLDKKLALAKSKLQEIRDRYELAAKEINRLKQSTL